MNYLKKLAKNVQVQRAARLFIFTFVPLVVASHNHFTLSALTGALVASAEVVYRQYFPA